MMISLARNHHRPTGHRQDRMCIVDLMHNLAEHCAAKDYETADRVRAQMQALGWETRITATSMVCVHRDGETVQIKM